MYHTISELEDVCYATPPRRYMCHTVSEHEDVCYASPPRRYMCHTVASMRKCVTLLLLDAICVTL